MKILLGCISVICAFLIMIIVNKVLNSIFVSSDKVINDLKTKIERKNIFIRYSISTKEWLKKMGVSYMLKREMSVYSFVMLRVISALVCFVIAGMYFSDFRNVVNDIILIISVIAGANIPNVFIKMSNSMDNDMMLDDIKIMYDTLRIQSKAGVYIADILTECYMLVRTTRLKAALRELSNHIYTKHDLSSGLQDFSSKFKNVYIDMLVMTIEQSLKSGQTIQMFQDIAQQIQQVEYALYEKEKRRAENKMLAYQLAVYFGILMLVVYAMFSQLVKTFVF